MNDNEELSTDPLLSHPDQGANSGILQGCGPRQRSDALGLSTFGEGLDSEQLNFDEFIDFSQSNSKRICPYDQLPSPISQLDIESISQVSPQDVSQAVTDINSGHSSTEIINIGVSTHYSSSNLPHISNSTGPKSSPPDSEMVDRGSRSNVTTTKMAISTLKSSYTCLACGESLPTRLCFRSHIRRGCSDTRQAYRCDTCKRTFTLAKDLKRHQGSASSCLKSSQESKKIQFPCICGRRFTRKDTLLRHLRVANKPLGANKHRSLDD